MISEMIEFIVALSGVALMAAYGFCVWYALILMAAIVNGIITLLKRATCRR